VSHVGPNAPLDKRVQQVLEVQYADKGFIEAQYVCSTNCRKQWQQRLEAIDKFAAQRQLRSTANAHKAAILGQPREGCTAADKLDELAEEVSAFCEQGERSFLVV
jgi:hypothetical protein